MLRSRIVVPLLCAATAFAQHHSSAAGNEKPVALYRDLGVWTHPIATRSAQGQKFFDQGLALLYGFNKYEALRSFRKAGELDPHAAMAFWGMAMAAGPYINMDGDPDVDMKTSCAAVDTGLKLSGTPERERAYLEAAAARCPEFKPQDYIEAMKALAARYPDDLDAQTLYAESIMVATRWHWYTADGKPADGMPEAERVLEEVLRRWPDHPGANHLYIHAVESSLTPERAIPSAQRLMGIVPAAGHMVHMPGHIWLRTGDWETAAGVNERAAEVDRRYFAETNVSKGAYRAYYVHNLSFVVYARAMQGRKADALRASAAMKAETAPMAQAMPEMADAFVAFTLFAPARFGDWDTILKQPQPSEKMPATTSLWRYARALAFAGRGDRAAAAGERQAFENIRAHLPADAPWGQNKASEVMAMASEIIQARLAASPADEIPHWRRAVELQDTFTYDEPPAWYYPVRESLGGALLRAGQPAEAEAVFRDGVRRIPQDGRMLFGLMQSLKAQRKQNAAESVRREFDAAWRKAEVQLTISDL